MELDINIKELATAINGKLIYLKKDKKINSFITDTRRISSGDVFWALKGKNFNGNDFIEEAVKKGAKGIIAERSIKLDDYNKLDFFIRVNDSLKALHLLAQKHLERLDLKTVSVTGSNGKTTVKEMTKDVLSSYKKTVYNHGNLNNEYGLPLSVLEATKKDEFGVFEIGSSSVGEVKKLARIVKPDISVITTIAPEHLEFFKTMENIFKTETEVLNELKNGGLGVINGDNEYLKKLKTKKNIISFGFLADNNLVIDFKENFSSFNFKNKRIKIRLKNHIKHNYLNAAAAFISGYLFGVPEKKIIAALEKFDGVPLRMQIIKRKKSVIILDAYNANPQSMDYALSEISKKKRFAVILGDMKELGRYSKRYHTELAKRVSEISPEYVFLIGPEIKVAYDCLKKEMKNVKYYSNTDLALKYVRDFIKENDDINILIKASRSMKFERFIAEN
jgi:UDP-N-acetylmuramoyl-tripeptide--D-alanyl-D-alanine ligase